MTNNTLEEIKKILLHEIQTAIPVADHQTDKHIKFGLLAQAALLENLGARIEILQLPESFVCSVMDDVRQATLLLLENLRTSMTGQQQELVSHVDAIGEEISQGLAALQRPRKGNGDERTREQRLSQLVSDLHALGNVAISLRSCMEKQRYG